MRGGRDGWYRLAIAVNLVVGGLVAIGLAAIIAWSASVPVDDAVDPAATISPVGLGLAWAAIGVVFLVLLGVLIARYAASRGWVGLAVLDVIVGALMLLGAVQVLALGFPVQGLITGAGGLAAAVGSIAVPLSRRPATGSRQVVH